MFKQVQKTADRPVEISLNLKIAKKSFALVSEALKAVMALAGQQITLEPLPAKPRAAKAKPGPASQAGRKAKPAKVKPAESRPEKSPLESAALIRNLRIKAGLSQKAIATKLGLTQNQVSLLETGKQSLKPALAKKFGRLFNTSIPAQS